MNRKKIAWLPWALCALVVGGALCSLVLTLELPATRSSASAVLLAVLNALNDIAFGVVGALILSRLRHNRIGWLLMTIALAFLLPVLMQNPAGPNGQPTFLTYLWSWLNGWSWWLLIGPLLLILLLFPTGSLLSRRWRWVVGLIALLFSTFMVLDLLSPTWQDPVTRLALPNPLLQGHAFAGLSFQTVQVPWAIVTVITVALCAASVFVRYRRSGEVERTQIKWFLYACVIFIAVYTSAGLLFIGTDPPAWMSVLLSLVILFLPLSIGVAILRYHLYEIDIIIRRTLVYVPLTAILAGVFAACIRISQTIFSGLTGSQSQAATVLTTLIVVAAFDPLKGWLQRAVDTRFKDAVKPEQRWKEYAGQVKAFIEMNDANASAKRLLKEAATAYNASGGAIHLKRAGKMQLVHSLGDWHKTPEVTVTLEHNGQTVGRLSLGTRRNGRPYEPHELALLADTAGAVAAAIARVEGE
jgi:MFS family permease